MRPVGHFTLLVQMLRGFEFSSVIWHYMLGWQEGKWWGNGMVICLERGANDLHMVQLMPLWRHHVLLQ